jgi:hypothetical protein
MTGHGMEDYSSIPIRELDLFNTASEAGSGPHAAFAARLATTSAAIKTCGAVHSIPCVS